MGDAYLAYKRARFATRLPRDRVFTPAHYWLLPQGNGVQKVGFTKFATRMLGESVEFEFEVAPGAQVDRGQAIGWFEGFKAVTELYSPAAGRFVGPNPDLEEMMANLHRAPYDRGWLYLLEGDLPDDALDADGYAAFLDQTIDRMTGRGS